MAKEDIDLWLILGDPVEARKYIEDFDWRLPERPGQITMEGGRTIYFESMSDEDAVIAAMAILRDIEIPRIEREELCFVLYTH